jgi:sugar lactone lactonase YvrE
MTLKSKRGFDSYLTAIVSGRFEFRGGFNETTLDLPALIAIVARQFGVNANQITLKVLRGSVIIVYTIRATVIQANTILANLSTSDKVSAFGVILQASLIVGAVPGLTLVSGNSLTGVVLNKSYVSRMTITAFVGNGTSSLLPGIGTQARLVYPSGIALDSVGNMYVIDSCSKLLKITPAGVMTVLATVSTTSVNVQGYVTVDTSGNIYVKLSDSEKLQKFLPNGTPDPSWNISYRYSLLLSGITINADETGLYASNTLANYVGLINLASGGFGPITDVAEDQVITGFKDGFGYDGQFNAPTGLALDSLNNILYVADTNNHAIRAIDLGIKYVSTVAGNGTPGWVDDIGLAARFNGPTTLAYNLNIPGFLFVADTGNHAIRRIDLSNNKVETIAGTGVRGSDDGAGQLSTLNGPYGLALTDSSILYIADSSNYLIRKINLIDDPLDNVIILGQTALPSMLGITANNTDVYVTDYNNHKLCRMDIFGNPITVAGSTQGFANGTALSVKFNTPCGICNDGYYLYLCDTYNYCVRRVNMYTFETEVIAGKPGVRASAFGIGSDARFQEITSIAYDGIQYLYATDPGGRCVVKIDSVYPYTVTKIAGNGSIGYSDGPGLTDANFNYMWGLTYDTTRYLYLCDGANNRICRIDTEPPYNVLSVGGKLIPARFPYFIAGHYDGEIGTSIFNGPQGIAYNENNNCLYVADTGNSVIRKMDIDNNYRTSTVVGRVGDFRTINGDYSTCSFNRPSTCGFDSVGNLLVAEWGLPGYIRKVKAPLP